MIDPSRIWSSPNLPTLPTAALRLIELSRVPSSDLQDVVAAIKSDPATTAKVLRAANSSYFGFVSKVTSVDRAVPLLGTTVVTSLALSFSLADAAKTGGPFAARYAECWRLCATQAAAAEALAGDRKEGLLNDFFLAGLLADLGRLAMLKAIPDAYTAALDVADRDERDLCDAETEALGFDHVGIGVKLIERWNLPTAVARAAAFHHAPVAALRAEAAAADFPVLRAVAIAAAAADYCCRPNKAAALARLRELTAEFCGFDARGLDAYLRQVAARFERIGALYSVGAEPLPDPADLLVQANEQLARITFDHQLATARALDRQRLAEEQKESLERQNAELQQQVRHDPLTRVYNRGYFDDVLERELVRAGRGGEAVGVLFCDIDRFKSLNDTYGHAFGDAVLRQVAAALAEGLRRCDVLARYGGEEFVVLVSQPTEAGLAQVAERLRARVEAAAFETDGVTVSVGGAIALPGRGEAVPTGRLLAEADSAMYASKRGGRNRVTIRSLMNDEQSRLTRLVAERRFSRWLVARGAVDAAVVNRSLPNVQTPRRLLGEIARDRRWLADPDVARILAAQCVVARFGETAVLLGLLDEPRLADLLARQQEEPRRLAAALVAAGALSGGEANALLAEHARLDGDAAMRDVAEKAEVG